MSAVPLQAYQNFNAHIRAFTKTSPKLHYLVCGWNMGPTGLLRNATLTDLNATCRESPACVEKELRYKIIRTELYSDGIHPNMEGALDFRVGLHWHAALNPPSPGSET